MEDNIPVYNESYTEEENRILHEYIINASDAELVNLIDEACALYAEENKTTVKEALNGFAREIQARDEMKQRYDILLKCKKDWGHYYDGLYNYKNALYIREKYKSYKKYHVSDHRLFKEYYENDPIIKNAALNFIRRCTFSEDSKNGIKKPEQPETYYDSLEDVPVEQRLDFNESLEKLGVENLRYLLYRMVASLGYPQKERAAGVLINFLTRKYSTCDHKKIDGTALFSTNLSTYLSLKEQCLEYLQEMISCKKSSEEISKTLKAQKTSAQ